MSKANDTSKVTPGPWRLRRGAGDGDWRFQIWAGKTPVAYWTYRNYPRLSNAEKGVHIANARLMAQAPQLRDERDELRGLVEAQRARIEALEDVADAVLGEIEVHGWNGADWVLDRLKKLLKEQS